MVSVFEGQLTRTWFYEIGEKKHVLNLYHDTISGVRSAMLDYQEIRGSLGNSSLLMDSKGHRIFFTIENLPGYIEIKRSGWTGFVYACCINDRDIKEVTQGVPENQDLVFEPKILDTVFTQDELSEYQLAWYVIRTRRITDGAISTVHRRFREFAELNSQIKQNMKGHHLRDVLPPLPEKPLKQFTDHTDLAFIQDRCFKLERFLINMNSIPHVANMVCMKAFLGIMDQVREYSLVFQVPTLGLSLLPTERQGEPGTSPCVVGMIQKPEVCKGVLPGDQLSRVNGVPLQGSTFAGAVARIKTVPRPMIIHFIQVIGAQTTPASDIAAPVPVSPITAAQSPTSTTKSPSNTTSSTHTGTYASPPVAPVLTAREQREQEQARLVQVASALAAKEAAEKERLAREAQEQAQREKAEKAEKAARVERERLEKIEKEKEAARQLAIQQAKEKKRQEQLALFMDEPVATNSSTKAGKSSLFGADEPVATTTTAAVATTSTVPVELVDIDIVDDTPSKASTKSNTTKASTTPASPSATKTAAVVTTGSTAAPVSAKTVSSDSTTKPAAVKVATAPASAASSSAATSPTTSGTPSKNPLFSDEVAGFGVAPVRAAPVPAPVAAPKAKAATSAPVAVTTTPTTTTTTPATSRSLFEADVETAASNDSSVKASTSNPALLGWD